MYRIRTGTEYQKDDFNDMPENAIKISQEDYFNGIRCYITEPKKVRQVYEYDCPHFHSKLVHLAMSDLFYQGWQDLGYGMGKDSNSSEIIFFRYGKKERWEQFIQRFADQFQGDHS